MDEELGTLLEGTPNWLFRTGISLIGFALAVFILLSAFIKYPDVTISSGIITSERPPIDHKCNTTGIIDSLYVTQNSLVNIGDQLLSIKNTCNIQDLKTIIEFITTFQAIKRVEEYLLLDFPHNLHLGEMQSDYVNFEIIFLEFIGKVREPFFEERLGILRREISNIENLNAFLQKQADLLNHELSLVKKDHNRSAILRSNNVISEVDMEKADIQLLNIQKHITSSERDFIENKIRSENIRLEINRLESEKFNIQHNYLIKLKGTLNSLTQSIKNWEEKYIVTAKVSGKLLYPGEITDKIKVNENDLVAVVLPTKATSTHFVRATASDKGFGKIKIGTRVILKVNGYPYKQYGVIISRVTWVSPLPKEDKTGNLLYDLTVSLPEKMVTNYDVEIPFRPNTGVTAEILDEEKSILERIFQQFLNLIKQH